MPLDVSLTDLMDYTEWERGRWRDCLRRQDRKVLEISPGPHGDGRFGAVGDLVKHIFAAEKRYVDRLAGRPITDPASVPNDDLEALFEFGRQSRADLRQLLDAFPTQNWDIAVEFKLGNSNLRATPRKIVVHVLMHEIRHWAQIGTLLRSQGITDGFHDFLFSPVMGGNAKLG